MKTQFVFAATVCALILLLQILEAHESKGCSQEASERCLKASKGCCRDEIRNQEVCFNPKRQICKATETGFKLCHASNRSCLKQVSPTLTKFIDQLPLPAVAKPSHDNKKSDCKYYEITMKQIQRQLHSELPPTTLYGYDGMYPGPTIHTEEGECVRVKWENELPPFHILPVDTTVHGAEPAGGFIETKTTVHLHGARVPDTSDGNPESWFTADFKFRGPKWSNKVYQYPNNQRSTMLFYHDHALGITRLNVYAGLAGLYFIHGPEEARLRKSLPNKKFEVPLVIQDKSFYEDGSLFYPTGPEVGEDLPYPSVVPEFFGDTMLVNGKVWPYLTVEPRKYRFRLLNACNSRFLRLFFSNGMKLTLIGNEGGFFESPRTVDSVLMSPAERYDAIVDFTDAAGQEIILRNDAATPFPDGDPVTDDTAVVMQFRVLNTRKSKIPDPSDLPEQLSVIETLTSSVERLVRLTESVDEFGRVLPLLNDMDYDDPPTEIVPVNQVETWLIQNETPDTHPIHLHLVHFQLVERIPIPGMKAIAPPRNITEWNQDGKEWKDTIQAPPGMITKIIARFGPFCGDYVWHCHILEHEDHEMMRPLQVVGCGCKNNPK